VRKTKKTRVGRDSEARRARIIEAAIKVLTSKGVTAFSARSIAAESPLTKSALHYYFADMDELLDEAETEITRRYFRRLQGIATQQAEPVQRFWAVVDGYFKPFEDNLPMAAHWLEYWVNAMRRGKARSVELILSEMTDLFAGLLKPLGVSNPEQRARSLVSFFNGEVMRQLSEPINRANNLRAVADLCGLPAPGAAAVKMPVRPAPPAHLAWSSGSPAHLILGTDELIVERSGAVGRLIFNRPQRSNAMTDGMLALLPGVCAALSEDPDIRVIVMRGAGRSAFVSGSDIGEIVKHGPAEYARDLYAKSGFPQLAGIGKPVVAQIHGACMGGGIMLASAADLRIAAADSKFGIPVAAIGAAYPVEAAQRLAQLIGPSRAARMLFTGEIIGAEDALRIGLIDQVVEPDRLEETVAKLAGHLATRAPLSLRAAKQAIQSWLDPARLDDARRAFAAAWGSEDARRGIEAAAKKQSTRFEGR